MEGDRVIFAPRPLPLVSDRALWYTLMDCKTERTTEHGTELH